MGKVRRFEMKPIILVTVIVLAALGLILYETDDSGTQALSALMSVLGGFS
jgi:hypothetical protein